MPMHGKRIAFIAFLPLLLVGITLNPWASVSGFPHAPYEADEVIITITILSAYYTDADGDGFADDVVAHFDVALSGAEAYVFDMFPSLTLPSGLTYIYWYTVLTNCTLIHFTITFYNHITESGWYIFAIATLYFSNNGRNIVYAEFPFDPPGGSPDQDPC
ncbi:MAG: hypothetical protein ACFFCO_09505 [Promethearchaeota archaeon]